MIGIESGPAWRKGDRGMGWTCYGLLIDSFCLTIKQPLVESTAVGPRRVERSQSSAPPLMPESDSSSAAALRSKSDDELVTELAALIRKCVPEAGTADIQIDSLLIDDLGIDSLGAYELIMEAEDLFEIEISDSQVEGIKTVRDLIAIVRASDG